jgi:hypothetical protein
MCSLADWNFSMEKNLKKTPINPNNWNYSETKDKEAEIKKAAETAIHL